MNALLDAVLDLVGGLPSLWMLQWAVAGVLLGLAAIAMPLAWARAWRVLAAAPSPTRAAFASALVAAAVARWALAPKWIATVFIGYRATDEAIRLFPVPHYGIGTPALYHLLFAPFGADHRTLIWSNAVIGVLTLPLVAAFAARYLRSHAAAAVVALLVALTPMFVRNDTSDANNVPLLLWLFGGLVLWEAALDTGDRLALAAAGALFALAAICRPELPLFLLVLVPATAWALEPTWRPSRSPVAWAVALAFALLVLPQLINTLYSIRRLRAASSLPGWSVGHLGALFDLRRDALANPRIFPLALTLLAAAGVRWPGPAGARRARTLVALAAVYFALTLGDLDWANLARVQVPIALFACMLASLGALALVERARRREQAVAMIAFVAGASAVPTALQLWRPTNEQAEEEFLREALAALPAGPLVFVRPGSEDMGVYFTHPYFPDYLLGPQRRPSSVTRWLSPSRDEGPAYFYLGMRCYAEFRQGDAPRPHGEHVNAACARLRDDYRLAPVLERTVPNRGDVWLPYYGDAPELKLGLYRVLPRDAARAP